MAGSVATAGTRERLAFPGLVRQLAAVGCAAALVGGLVGGVGGRLAMRLLAATNPRTTGLVTDDGFVVGRVSAGGSLQLVAASIQFAMLGAVVYLLVRPLLLGPPGLRVATVSLGAGGTAGALLVHPGGLDFESFDPVWLPVVLFVALPILHVALFAALAERWLAEGSWFSQAPVRLVAPALLVWLVGAAALVIVLPVLVVCLGVLLLLQRHPPAPAVRTTATWGGRLALVAVFAGAVVDLARDVAVLA
jgi:hypothetical protein